MERQIYVFGAVMLAMMLLTSGCSTSAYREYLSALSDYNHCGQDALASAVQCEAKRDRLDTAWRAYKVARL